MSINLQAPDIRELKPRITVFGIGGAGSNAVNNMIESGLMGVDFVAANTDAQALSSSKANRIIQMGLAVTEGLGAGSQPEIGRAAAEEVIDEIRDQLAGSHMAFITAGMGGGTGTGAAPVIARTARDMGILTVGVVTKPFQFEGARRMRIAEAGIGELHQSVDTLIVIPNQNLFRVANEKTTFADAFAMADQVLYSGVACITDLMVKEGLINLDFADVRSIMRGMGKAMMGTGEASGEARASRAAEAAIANPLLDETSMKGARGLLISITGGNDLTLYEVDEAATRIREEVDQDANIILGATFDESLEGIIRVSVVATGIDQAFIASASELSATEQRIAEVAERLRAEARARVSQQSSSVPSITVPVAAPIANPVQVTPRVASVEVAPAPKAFVTMATPVSPQVQKPIAAPVQVASLELPVQENVSDNMAFLKEENIAFDTPAQAESVYHEELPVAEDPVYEAPRAPVSYQPSRPVHVERNSEAAPVVTERTMIRPARMPRVEDLPMPVQNQIRASQAVQEPQQEQKPGRMTLLQRLATVGFGRKDDAVQASQASQPVPSQQPRQPLVRPAHPQYRVAQGNVAQGQLDQQGRQTAQPQFQSRTIDDEHLEIPAFLRRQAQ